MHRIKAMVAVKDRKTGQVKLFEFMDERKADKFIERARIEGFEAIKGKPT